MFKKITYRRASKFEPGKNSIHIWNEPTTNKSLAALELLNEQFRLGEITYWEKVLNFTKDKHAEFNWHKCNSTDKLRVLRSIFNRRFLERSDLVCPRFVLTRPVKEK